MGFYLSLLIRSFGFFLLYYVVFYNVNSGYDSLEFGSVYNFGVLGKFRRYVVDGVG